MTVDELSPAFTHVLLTVAAVAMVAAALRAASLIVPAGRERLLATVPIAVSAACLEALALGLVDLGGNPFMLTFAALATAGAAIVALPAPEVRVGAELAQWWIRLSKAERAGLGAIAGVILASAAWMLEYPLLGTDGVQYRLPAVVAWVQDGSPGARFPASPDFATDAYPLGHELVLSWGMGISRSFVLATVATPLLMALAGLSGWHGLRALGVPRLPSALAVLAVLAVPSQMGGLNEVSSDIAALAWTACAAALCTGVRRRPAILAPALLSAALALGTKTTVLVPLLFGFGVAAWSARGSLRPVRGLLLVTAVAAATVGGFWYLRNLVLHGSPFWPFLAAPWGDPSPPLLEALDHSLLERPRATLSGQTDLYLRTLAGGLVLAVGALIVPLFDRTRATLVAWAAAGLALLAYASAPVTGVGDAGLPTFAVASLRYLGPALGACALAVALTARRGGRPAALACLVLGTSAAWSIALDAQLDFPRLPSVTALGLGVLAGGILGLAVGLVPSRAPSGARRPAGRAARAAGAAAVVASGLLLSLPASGYVARNARLADSPLGEIPRFFAGPAAPAENTPVAISATPDARVAGDRLRRPVILLRQDLPCARYRRGWAVLTRSAVAINKVSDLRLKPGPLERCLYSDQPVAAEPALSAIYPPRPGVQADERPRRD